MFELMSTWKSAYPEAALGVLAMGGVSNPPQHQALSDMKENLEWELREKYSSFDRPSLKALPIFAAYIAYYKRFNKTYHVQHQLESIVFKNRSIPRVAALVEAMFMAELKNLLLTAGHDLNYVELPLRIDVAQGTESYRRMNGEEQALKPGDMMIADATGIISCIIYGPDQRTRIRPETDRIVFTVYGAPGISENDVYQHLKDIRQNVLVIAPEASVELLHVYSAD